MKLISQYKGLRKENYILCFGRLVTAMGAMVRPMLTMILSQKMGIDATGIAWIIAGMGLLSFPANLLGGRMADRFDKKMNIVYLDIVSVVCYLVCVFIPLSAISIVLIFLASACQEMENPSYNALTADMTRIVDRERSYSLQYMMGNLGFAVAPVVAGILFKNYLWLAFLISGLSIGASSIFIFLFVQDISPEQETGFQAIYQKERTGESLWDVLRDHRLILLYMLVTSGFAATYQMYNYLMPLDLVRLHGDSGPLIYGSVTSVNCVVVVLGTPVITRLFGRLADPTKTIIGEILMLAGFAGFLIFSGHIPVYYLAMIVLTWGEIFNMLAESPYLSKRIPSSHRGRVNGMLGIVRAAICSAYQLFIGMIYGAMNSAAAWSAVLLIGIFFVLITVVLAVRDRKAYGNLYRK